MSPLLSVKSTLDCWNQLFEPSGEDGDVEIVVLGAVSSLVSVNAVRVGRVSEALFVAPTDCVSGDGLPPFDDQL